MENSMFKSVLQAFKKVKWKTVGKGIYKWAQILAPIIVLGLTIYLGLKLRTDEYFQSWEQACVYSTLIYTVLIELYMGSKNAILQAF